MFIIIREHTNIVFGSSLFPEYIRMCVNVKMRRINLWHFVEAL